MIEPTVSVVIPSYNHAAYISAAVESVLLQTHEPDEILIIDDGSTDETGEVVARFGERVRFIPRSHSGIGANYNYAVAQARSDLIGFLESDDLWEPEYLSRCLAFLAANEGCEWVSTARRHIDGEGRRTGELAGKKTPGPFFTTEGFLLHDMGTSPTPVVRRASLLEVGPFAEDTYGADSDMALRFSLGHRMGYVDEPLYLYRRHDRNASGVALRDAVELLKILRRFQAEQSEYVNSNSRIVRRGLAKFAGRVAAQMMAADPDIKRDDVMPLLREALRLDPMKLRHIRRYLAVLALGPGLYGRSKRRRDRGSSGS